MKKITPFLLLLILLVPSQGSGEPAKIPLTSKDATELGITQLTTENAIQDNEKNLAAQKVKDLPGKHAKTVDLYITRMAMIPGGSDLGWQVNDVDDGYEVIRQIQKGLRVFSFKWGVSGSGEITPLNKRAKDITKKTDPVPEKPAD